MKIYDILLDKPVPFMEVNVFAKEIDPNVIILTVEDYDDRTYQCYSEKVANAIKEKFLGSINIIEFDPETLLK